MPTRWARCSRHLRSCEAMRRCRRDLARSSMMNLKADILSTLPGIAHGFFGRRGGGSRGIYASLNCGPGSGDARADVLENRRRVSEALGGAALVTLGQIHSPDVVTVTKPWSIGATPAEDA